MRNTIYMNLIRQQFNNCFAKSSMNCIVLLLYASLLKKSCYLSEHTNKYKNLDLILKNNSPRPPLKVEVLRRKLHSLDRSYQEQVKAGIICALTPFSLGYRHFTEFLAYNNLCVTNRMLGFCPRRDLIVTRICRKLQPESMLLLGIMDP